MSKLAHSNQETMDRLDVQRAMQEGNEDLLPDYIGLPLIALKAIWLAEGRLKGHPYYLTKYQMIALASGVLEKLSAKPSKEL